MSQDTVFKYPALKGFSAVALCALWAIAPAGAQQDSAAEPLAGEQDAIAVPPPADEGEDDFDAFLRSLDFDDLVDDADDRPGGVSESDESESSRPAPSVRRDGIEVRERPAEETDEGAGSDRRRAEDRDPDEGPKRATIRALEKVTARITDLDIDVGDTTRFKSLMITVRMCHKRPPEETPETTAFLEVVERKVGGETEPVFTGWMLASSPGLSALEHPVYDVWVMDCKTLDPVRSAGVE